MKRIRATPAQKQGLDDLIETLPPGQRESMVEVGSFAGESTSIFAKKIGFVIAVDSYKEYKDGYGNGRTQAQLTEAKGWMDLQMKRRCNISLLQMESSEACTFIRPVVNMVYLDAAFTQQATLEMIRDWKGHCRFLCGHDYDIEGVKNAVDSFVAFNALSCPKTFQDSSWLIDQHDK